MIARGYLIGLGAAATVAALFFTHRATAGDVVAAAVNVFKSRGLRNNNPGNLRTLPASRAWRGQVADDGGYGVYDTMANGVRALGKQLDKYSSSGARTVRAIINQWAPPSENDTGSYVTQVAQALGVAADDIIDVHARLPEIAAAITRRENGEQPFELVDIKRWVYAT